MIVFTLKDVIGLSVLAALLVVALLLAAHDFIKSKIKRGEKRGE